MGALFYPRYSLVVLAVLVVVIVVPGVETRVRPSLGVTHVTRAHVQQGRAPASGGTLGAVLAKLA